MQPRYIVLANPDSKRWTLYAQELATFWRAHRIEPEIHLIPWAKIIELRGNVDELGVFDRPALLRVESPGKNFDVYRAMLQLGASDLADESTLNWRNIPEQKGRIVRPGLHQRGFVKVLSGLHASFRARPHLTLLAQPLEIVEQFDKRATCARLEAAGIPTPACLPRLGSPAAVMQELSARRVRTAYAKLNTGSSAMGIAVLYLPPPGNITPQDGQTNSPTALASMVRIGADYFNTRKLRRYSGAELDDVLRFLIGEDLLVQHGIPMAQIEGQNFDVRVVMIHGKPEFTIFRLSQAPMTNLYFGGQRGDTDECKRHIPKRAWLDALDHCVDTARLYSAAILGIDLLFERGYIRHHILEVNAFGDFFPDWTNANGKTVHAVEIEATARHFGLI